MMIGITGPIGAGKDTAAEFIEKEYGFKHVSGGDILREMLRVITLEPTKRAVFELGVLLRKHYGADIMIKMTMARAGQKDMITSAFRSIAEAEFILNSGGIIIYIDAPRALRHKRTHDRVGEVFDEKTLINIDAREWSSKSPLGGNLKQVKKIANEIIINDGSLTEFYKKLRAVVEKRLP